MTYFDASPLLDRSTIQDVEYVRGQWDAFAKLLADNTNTGNKGQKSKMDGSPIAYGLVTDHGQIDKMELPNSWVEGPATTGGIGTRSFREVHPETDPDAKLCFYYRGLPASDAAGKNFRNVLDKPAHILTKGEINSLSEILRGKDDPKIFTPTMIRTEELNGKLVLTVNGRLNEKQADLKAIIVDADGSGTVVQEIYFQAPKEIYLRYMKDARHAMNTINWK